MIGHIYRRDTQGTIFHLTAAHLNSASPESNQYALCQLTVSLDQLSVSATKLYCDWHDSHVFNPNITHLICFNSRAFKLLIFAEPWRKYCKLKMDNPAMDTAHVSDFVSHTSMFMLCKTATPNG